MKRVIKFRDGIAFIFAFAVGASIYTNFSETIDANDVFMVMFFMLVGFISIFFGAGEKV